MTAKPGLAEVLRTYGPTYLANHTLSVAQATAWRAIIACRTAALGGQLEACTRCGSCRYVYHSCRNRHCPQCQTRAKEAWLAARQRELLPVPYFHLVFTLPHVLNGVASRHPKLIYAQLFRAAASTLTAFAGNPRWLGGQPAFTLVLHTWQQNLGRHLHVHALVAGGALTADGQWRTPTRGFLFPVKALSKVFRGRFMNGLEQTLAERDSAEWRQVKALCYQHEWVVYAKQPLGGPAQVLDYLGRYTHRVAISNERIVAIDQGEVALRVRVNGTSGKRRILRLPGSEFIQRFLTHVLPKGFKRIRHYGLLGPAHKTAQLAAARTALQTPAPQAAVVESVAAFLHRVAQMEWLCCPVCRAGQMRVIEILPARASRPPLRGPP